MTDLTIDRHEHPIDSSNALAIFAEYDVIVDGTDNFPTRYLVNDACVLTGKPNVHGSIFQFEGQATVFYPGKGPCYRCLYPEPPPAEMAPSCAEAGVLGVLPGLIGVIEALEAVKLILGKGDTLVGRLLQSGTRNPGPDTDFDMMAVALVGAGEAVANRVSTGVADVDEAAELMINLFWRGLKGKPADQPARPAVAG